MTDIKAYRIGGLPLVTINGAISEKTGAELAAKIMGVIYGATEGDGGKALSLPSPRIINS